MANSSTPRGALHPKYLVDPNLNKAVPFNGSKFATDKIEPLIKEYCGIDTLSRMKRAAGLYRGDEKDGVQAIAIANPNVVDTEIAFSNETKEEKEKRHATRIDLACLEEVEGSIRLRFWEAKLYTNGEIKADGDAPAQVVEQVAGYRDLVERHRDELVKSYRTIARNLVDMIVWDFHLNNGPLCGVRL